FNLERARQALREGSRDHAAIELEAKKDLENRGWNVDYFEVRNTANLERAGNSKERLVVLGAATLGRTRLIDNLEV
ncbi:MAG TPA: pantoate--beta-alanine ligase, partial [Burkholderiales bacterium]|nr:pantoate--beta-alanine ligase [Burkholderiales bacterium]